MDIPPKQRSDRKRKLGMLAATVLTLAVLVGACGPNEAAPPAAPSGPPDAVASTVLDRTNADRAAQGLAPLAWNSQLAGLATEWAQHMADTRALQHRNLSAVIDSPGFEGYAALGENILVGPSNTDGNAMHTAWMSSLSHYRVIMGNYDSMGFGLAQGGDGNVRAVVNFGRSF